MNFMHTETILFEFLLHQTDEIWQILVSEAQAQWVFYIDAEGLLGKPHIAFIILFYTKLAKGEA